jgi:SAM-dependent methyltransferase
MASHDRFAEDYDRKAEEYDWRGPEVAFGLSYAFVRPGESILDIGIGTGLSSVLFHKAGLRVYGMDASRKMLEACRSKRFAADLKEHDLTVLPYPYETASLDHAACLGVLQFFRDLRPIFEEVSRIVRDEGIFVFIVGDRAPGETAQIEVGPEHTQSDATMAICRHSPEEIAHLLGDNDFTLIRSLEFPVPMDPKRTRFLPAKAYVAKRKSRS